MGEAKILDTSSQEVNPLMKKKEIYYSIVVVLTFLLAYYGRSLVGGWPTSSADAYPLRVVAFYAWWLLPSVVLTGALFGFKALGDSLGLNRSVLFGLGFAFVATVPMLISSAVIGRVATPVALFPLLHKTVLAGVMEEVFFRGFLFGLLFRKLRWGFIPASLLGAVIFGVGHLYQGSTPAEVFGVFSVTAMGAVWFAWLYIEWQNNLWVPVFLHILMNFSWVFFDVGQSALGDSFSNIFRVITIAFTVVMTLVYNRKREGLVVCRKNLFVHPSKTN